MRLFGGGVIEWVGHGGRLVQPEYRSVVSIALTYPEYLSLIIESIRTVSFSLREAFRARREEEYV